MAMNTVTPLELQSWLSNDPDTIQLVDVREADEHAEFNIGGELMPLTEIHEHMHRLLTDKKIVFYCKMGIRSMLAIQRIENKLGITGLFNLTGGMEAWKKEFPV